jgi:endo-alpha-1,4-polygalactosaminidase (GH114 family)
MNTRLCLGLLACVFPILLAGCPGDGVKDGSAGGGSTATATVWTPPPGTTWQWQISGTVDTSVDADVFDIDLFDSDAALVAKLHTQGRRVIAYVNVGAWEDWRDDADQFPAAVIGKTYSGYPDEKWLDIRQIDQLSAVLRARFDLAVEKGFDAIEPDNIDGYQNDTGFPLTAEDQLRFNRWLAEEAHARGLSIGLKNDPDQVSDLVAQFDWALTEDCFAEGWCEAFSPFIAAGKAVFAAEYTDMDITTDDFCAAAQQLGFSAILKRRDLDAWRETCP